MRNRSIVFAGLLGLVCTDVALAQATVPNTGFYLGVGLGKSHARFKTADFTAGDPAISESADFTDTGYKAFVGWQFTRYIATELTYVNLGRYSYSYASANGVGNVAYEASALALSGVGNIPLGKDWSALLRLGLSANKAERGGMNGDIQGAGQVPAVQKTKASPMAGIGLQYDVASNASLRFEFEYYGQFGEAKGNGTQVTGGVANFPDTTGRSNIWLFSLNAVARF